MPRAIRSDSPLQPLDGRRGIPAVGTLLESAELSPLLAASTRRAVTSAARAAVERVRTGSSIAPGNAGEWARLVAAELESSTRATLRPVMNATGVVLHTNLGRAPLAKVAIAALQEAASGYTNLEYDLDTGKRGSRYSHCVSLLKELTGCEDALVVNNCAAALVLAVDTFARERDVIVSRGELVEIGGSFRVPDIMERGGARLVEIGTTNRTHLADYEAAVTDRTGAIIKVHRSNFAISGFTSEVSVEQLVALGHVHGVPVVHDLGSGLLLDLAQYGLRGEVTALEALATGCDVVTLSGDKLLGGPQAGIILGGTHAVERMRSNPLTRALRVDKLTLSALSATLALYRDPAVALREVPVLAMLTATPENVRTRAEAVAARLVERGVPCEVVSSQASVGGGAFPTATLPSFAVALGGTAGIVEKSMRSASHPVIGRVKDGRLLLDLRSVPASEDETLAAAVSSALS